MVDTLPVDGCDVVTTLDIEMQDIVEQSLGEQLSKLGAVAGMCILMEVKTGDVKAISSLSRTKDGNYIEIEARAVSNMMEPGSVFKPMSFMVAMDDGKISMNSTCDTGFGVKEMYGKKMRDSNWRKGGDGVLTVPEIIKKSSNVGVSTLIDNAYASNPDGFVEGLHRIGITEDLRIPISEYKVPRIRFKRENPRKWYLTTLPWMSIGYETQIPPISTLTFYNGVANDGKLVRPRFVTAIRRGDETIREFPTEVLREQMCKPEVLRNIRICLEGVVGKNSGTGMAAYSNFFKVAGKTGTAQIWSNKGFNSRYLVSFAGYFPADRPRYSMIVCIEKGSPAYGGMHCGPVFKRVAETIMARELSPDYTAAVDNTENRKAVPYTRPGNLLALNRVLDNLGIASVARCNLNGSIPWGCNSGGKTSAILTPETAAKGVPSVIGYGLRDAVYRLERMGMRVKVKGCGRVVSQSVAPGSALKKGKTVNLVLSTDNHSVHREMCGSTHQSDSAPKDTEHDPEKAISSDNTNPPQSSPSALKSVAIDNSHSKKQKTS